MGSPNPNRAISPPGFYRRDTEDVLAFMDAVGLEKVHLLGYSDGGEVALMASGLQPERFLSATAWGAVGYFGPAMRPVVQRMFPVNWVTDEEMALHGIIDPEPIILQWIQSVKMMIDAGGDVSLSLAQQITCPLLLMLGEQDTLNPREYGQNFVDRVAKGRLEMFECGHAIHDLEWERFKQVVGDFLKSSE